MTYVLEMLDPKMSCRLNRESDWNHWFCLAELKIQVFWKLFTRITKCYNIYCHILWVLNFSLNWGEHHIGSSKLFENKEFLSLRNTQQRLLFPHWRICSWRFSRSGCKQNSKLKGFLSWSQSSLFASSTWVLSCLYPLGQGEIASNQKLAIFVSPCLLFLLEFIFLYIFAKGPIKNKGNHP